MKSSRLPRTLAVLLAASLFAVSAGPPAFAQTDLPNEEPQTITADSQPVVIPNLSDIEDTPEADGDSGGSLLGELGPAPTLPELQPLSEGDVTLNAAGRNELRFSSLTSQLISGFEGFGTVDVSEFASLNANSLDTLIGQDLRSSLPETTLQSSSLSSFLAEEGFVFAEVNATSYDDLRSQLVASAATPDGQVAAAAADWATRVAALEAPDLNSSLPEIPNSASTLATAPNEALVFGLFADKSLSAIATDTPDVLDSIFSGDLSTGEIQSRFEDVRLDVGEWLATCLLYTSPSPRDATLSRMPSSA